MSKPFLVVVVLLVLPTAFYFWKEKQDSAKRYAEIERQNRVAQKVFNALARFEDSPNGLTAHEASIAMDLASEEHLSNNRRTLLFNYYLSVRRCRLSRSRKDCNQMLDDHFAAMHTGYSMEIDPSDP
jgi:hypothetical protein